MKKFLIVAAAALALGVAPAMAQHGGGHGGGGHMGGGHAGGVHVGGGDRGIDGGGYRGGGGGGGGGHVGGWGGPRFGVDVPFAPCVPPFLNSYRCYGYHYGYDY